MSNRDATLLKNWNKTWTGYVKICNPFRKFTLLRNSAQLCIDFHIKSVKLSRDKIEFYFTKLLLQHCVIVFAPFREQKVIQKPMQNDLTNYFPNKRRAAKTLFYSKAGLYEERRCSKRFASQQYTLEWLISNLLLHI